MSTYSSPDASINQSFNDLSMNINAIFSIITNFCNTFNISYLKQQYTQNMQSFQHNANQQLFYTVINQISTFYDSFFSIQNQNQNIIQNCFNSISQKISEQQNLIHENESLKSQIECLRLSQSQQNSAQNAKSENKLTKIDKEGGGGAAATRGGGEKGEEDREEGNIAAFFIICRANVQ